VNYQQELQSVLRFAELPSDEQRVARNAPLRRIAMSRCRFAHRSYVDEDFASLGAVTAGDGQPRACEALRKPCEIC
jgi:hypothetical protein